MSDREKAIIETLREGNRELRAEIERLRTALAWYADEKNYHEEYYEDERCEDSNVMDDRGERARNALKGGE